MKFKLVLEIDVNMEGEKPETIKANLDNVINHAMGAGLITGNSSAYIETYRHLVTQES